MSSQDSHPFLLFAHILVPALEELEEEVEVWPPKVVGGPQPGEHAEAGVVAAEVLLANVLAWDGNSIGGCGEYGGNGRGNRPERWCAGRICGRIG